MDLKLEGKTVLITGGSRGIGFACAAAFLEEGASVTLVGSNAIALDNATSTLLANHAVAVKTIAADLSRPEGRRALTDTLQNVDILVNNAGAIPGGDLSQVSDDTWRQAWELKVYGYIDATRIALPAMMQRGSGVIVNVIGIAASMPRMDYLCGSVGNAALTTFTRAVGAHSTTRGVRVVGVHPGPTQTDRLKSLYEQRAKQKFGDASRWPEMLQHLPFGRAAKPEEMADLVVYLSSERASYLSGVVVDADGGAQYTN